MGERLPEQYNEPEVLRSYASILEKPRREIRPDGRLVLHAAGEICIAAAWALREQATAIEWARCIK